MLGAIIKSFPCSPEFVCLRKIKNGILRLAIVAWRITAISGFPDDTERDGRELVGRYAPRLCEQALPI